MHHSGRNRPNHPLPSRRCKRPRRRQSSPPPRPRPLPLPPPSSPPPLPRLPPWSSPGLRPARSGPRWGPATASAWAWPPLRAARPLAVAPARLGVAGRRRGREALAGGERLGGEADLLARQRACGQRDAGGDEEAGQRRERPKDDERMSSTVAGMVKTGQRERRRRRARSAVVARLEAHVAAPAARELARDREPEAGPRRPGRPGAAAVEALEDVLRLAGASPGPSSSTSMRARRADDPIWPPARRRARSRPERRGCGRGRRGRRAAAPGPAPSRAAPRRRGRGGRPPSARRRAAAAAPRSSGSRRRVGLAALAEQSSSETIADEAVDLVAAPPRAARARRVLGRGAGLLDSQPEPRQRRAELVRGVGDELALALEQTAEPRGHLVEGAREPLLLGGALDRGARREVAGRDARARPRRAAQGPRDLAAISAPAPRPSTSTSPPISASPSVASRTASSTASTLCVTRTAPVGRPSLRTGTAVARIARRASRLALAPGPCRPRARPRSRAGCCSRRRACRARRCRRARDRAGRPGSPGRAGAARRSRRAPCGRGVPAAVAATISAPPRACDFTSASTRSRTLTTSGTSRARIASSRT